MKNIFLAILFLTLVLSAAAQSSKWMSLAYTYSKGPVSPPYQYSYTISINNFGEATLSYTKSETTKEFPFNVDKKDLKELNNALKKSKVFSVSPDEMKADSNLLIGGSSKTLIITKTQAANLDQLPETIDVPRQVTEMYSENIEDLYDTIENLVPSDVWNQATGEW